MPTITCSAERIKLADAGGRMVAGLRVTCPRCGRSAEVFGQRGRSVKKCLSLLEEKCPKKGAKHTHQITYEPNP